MVFQRIIKGLSFREIAANLNVDHSTVCIILQKFEETGDVEAGKSPGRPSSLTVYNEFIILENILERPNLYLHEIRNDTSSGFLTVGE